MFLLVSAVEDGIATLTLNRPEKRNALSIALRDEARRYASMITQAPREVLQRTKSKIIRRAAVTEGDTLTL